MIHANLLPLPVYHLPEPYENVSDQEEISDPLTAPVNYYKTIQKLKKRMKNKPPDPECQLSDQEWSRILAESI